MQRTALIPLLVSGIAAFAAAIYLWLDPRFRHPDGVGSFNGTPVVQFVEQGDGRGREMELLQDFSYTDPSGRTWTAKAGYKTDGASIPPVFWSLVGAPFEGDYRMAAVIHDWYCFTEEQPWQDVHRVFYYASLAGGVTEAKAKLLYAAVMWGGPKWGKAKSTCFSSCHAPTADAMTRKPSGAVTFQPHVTLEEASELAKWVEETNPSLEAIDERAQKDQSHELGGLE